MDKTKKTGLAEKIIHAGFIVGLAHILLKFAGLIQVRFATQYLEPSLYEPILVVAFGGILNNLFLIGEEVIGPTFLTVFMKEREDGGESRAWKFASQFLTFQGLLLLLLVATIVCWPDFYIGLFTSWTPESQPLLYARLRTCLRILAPALWFLSLGSTTYVLLNGYKKFFLAAFGDTTTKICIILGLVVGMGIFGCDFRALLAGILIGSAGKLLTHLAGILGPLRNFRPSLNWRNPALKAMVILMIPLFAGIIFAKVRDVFNNVYILSRLDREGILMANDLGRKLFASIQWLVPYSLQIALFPFLCELVSKNDRQKLGEILGNSCRLLLTVFGPLATTLAALAMPCTIALFLGGKTGFELASWAGVSTACYTLVLPAAAVECVLMQGFFADRRAVAVTVIGISASLLAVVISYVCIVVCGISQPVPVLCVVSLGFVLSRFLKSCALACYFQRSAPLFQYREIIVFLLKVLALSLLTGGCAWLLSQAVATVLPDGIADAFAALQENPAANPAVSRLRIFLRLAIAGGGACLAFCLGSILLRLQEPRLMLGWVKQKLHRK